MAGKVNVKTLWSTADSDDWELRRWRGYNVTRKLAAALPEADTYGKWYVYKHPAKGWCLIHGKTGLSGGYGRTINKAIKSLAERSPEEIRRAIERHESEAIHMQSFR